jgi:hypothetical protein
MFATASKQTYLNYEELKNENEVEVPSSVINHGFLLLFNF